MTKTIPTTLGILIVLLFTGLAGASVLLFNQDVEEEVVLEEDMEEGKYALENDETIKSGVSEIFIATTENYDDFLNILIFSPSKKQVVFSKKISLDAPLADSKSHSSGSNDSVQYNPKTKEIFFSTKGYSDFAGGPCQNKDGTCISRFYKIGIDQDKPTVLFESNNPPSQWIVNSFDNSLLLTFWEDDYKSQFLKKISGQDGKTIFKKEDYQVKKNTRLNDFMLSEDGEYTFQTVTKQQNEVPLTETLVLRKINNSNGDVIEQKVFEGQHISCSNTNLSPDNNYLAFYADHLTYLETPANLYIYEISTKKLINIPYQGSIHSSRLIWSGDSKKLLYFPKNSLAYYDIPMSKNVFISGEPRLAYDVYIWAPSINYFAYKSQNNEIKIFDIQKSQSIDTGVIDKIYVRGINWH